MSFRIGHGYDTHRLVSGRPLILGGVTVPFEKGLDGHSDADVLAHAVMDALLGAAALGDIGEYFPDSDERYKGVSSLKLLREVRAMVKALGYFIENIDATVILQRPNLSEYKQEMERNIADILEISAGAVNVKATTEEGLGITGSGEAASAHAVCLLS
jgi:2-C-methyl-D-erythritol 2,4-cyclodiphosphate synthase